MQVNFNYFKRFNYFNFINIITRECEKKIAGILNRFLPRIIKIKRIIIKILANISFIFNNYYLIRVAEKKGVAYLFNSI